MREYIYCYLCGAEYSADAGDYWERADDHLFRCCNRDSVLMRYNGQFVNDALLQNRVTVGDLRGFRAYGLIEPSAWEAAPSEWVPQNPCAFITAWFQFWMMPWMTLWEWFTTELQRHG